jgi:hypothetical protein
VHRKLVLVALAGLGFLLAPAAKGDVGAPLTAKRAPGKPFILRVGPGPRRVSCLMSEPAGVILLLRLTVPHGSRVNLTGRIPHVAGVGISTDGRSKCHRRGAVDVCTQPEEWCPMPPAAWRFVLRKLAGPRGEVRVDFVIGSPPGG